MSELKNVKVGDNVVYKYDTFYSGRLIKVTRITPSGRIVCGKMTFTKDGRIYGASPYSCARIEPVTQNILDRIEREKITRYIQNADLSSVPLTVLQNIYCRLQKEDPESHD